MGGFALNNGPQHWKSWPKPGVCGSQKLCTILDVTCGWALGATTVGGWGYGWLWGTGVPSPIGSRRPFLLVGGCTETTLALLELGQRSTSHPHNYWTQDAIKFRCTFANLSFFILSLVDVAWTLLWPVGDWALGGPCHVRVWRWTWAHFGGGGNQHFHLAIAVITRFV